MGLALVRHAGSTQSRVKEPLASGKADYRQITGKSPANHRQCLHDWSFAVSNS
jgi:hypothetical protein